MYDYVIHTIFIIVVKIKHIIIPTTVGSIMDSNVHFMLPVSFFMVRHVVEQGQCASENIIIFIAVSQLHPLLTNNCRSSIKLSNSVMTPVCI